MSEFVKKNLTGLLNFSGSLASMVNVFSLTACISLNNQPYMAIPTLIDLNPNEYNQKFHYYSFTANLNMCKGNCNMMIHPISMHSKQNRRCNFKCF